MLRALFTFFMAVFMVTSAEAAPQKDWSFTFPVISAQPTDPHDANSVVRREMIFNPDVGYTIADGSITSDWSYISCEMWDNHVIARFDASVTNWPSSWPKTVTCTQPDPNGGAPFTLKLALTNIIPGRLDNYDRDWTPTSPAQINLEDSDALGHGEGAKVVYRLPAGTYFTPSYWYKAKKSGGSNWNEVFCGVDSQGSASFLYMFIRQDSGGGSGYCSVYKYGSGWQQFNFDINRL